MKWIVILVLAAAACGPDDKLTVEQLQDPNTCNDCHATHYTQWSGSMHAYAADDPVFIAMNRRGQRETNGALGKFCINCHAPMAVLNGTITDENAKDFDPNQLSPAERGITCYFCHNVEKVVSDHNNGLVLAMDTTMRGGAKNPVDSPAHHSKYDPLVRSDTNQSELCGSCHDIVLPNGVAIERTFKEWKEGVFSKPDSKLTCGNCHMKPSDGVIASKQGLSVISRPNGFHEHTFPGIDQALTPWPEMEAQAEGIREILEPSVAIVGPKPRTGTRSPGGICVDPQDGGRITVRLDSLNLGHSFPSGSAFDRRVWMEVTAYRMDNSIFFQSGKVPDLTDPEQIGDTKLFGLWDKALKTDGTSAHFFWDVASIDPTSRLLTGSVTFDQNDPRFDHAQTAKYTNLGNTSEIVRIEAALKIRPLPYETLRDLVASGDLDPAVIGQLKTLEPASARSTWLRSTAGTGLAVGTNCNPE
ncbi:MAG: hypothetical protein H0T46_16910 [Deltaproteobacteria bacterium]|nr:hypothetical protein [Deltaproteobacteria bacterium]